MADCSFYNAPEEQSIVKSNIVEKYFDAWAKVMMSSQDRYGREQKIAYIDLFAGPGRYSDGTISTPIKILRKAIADENLCRRLVSIFNDKDEAFVNSLQNAIEELKGIEKLKYKPKIYHSEVGTEIVKKFEAMHLIPTLFFVDPWGYKGLSLRLINSVLKDWGCDGIFFFNYNRINMGLSNQKVKEHMDALFGEVRSELLSSKICNLSSRKRELTIVEELCAAIKSYGDRYVLPFRFKDQAGNRTTHHLIFVSKNIRGYNIMKDIMGKESSDQLQGVPSFEYSPADFMPKQSLLFKLSRPLDELQDMLLSEFTGRRLKMIDIYNEHNVDTPFVDKNYKKALIKHEEEGKIFASKHRKGSFGDNILVTFPQHTRIR